MNVFFVTIDWQGKLQLLKSDYKGNNLEVLHNMQTNFLNPMSDVDLFMLSTNDGLYVTIANKIYFYNFETFEFCEIYTAAGYIKDICKKKGRE